LQGTLLDLLPCDHFGTHHAVGEYRTVHFPVADLLQVFSKHRGENTIRLLFRFAVGELDVDGGENVDGGQEQGGDDKT